MNLAVHAAAGITAQRATGSWRRALPMAFMSHMVLDGMWPVWHEPAPWVIALHVGLMGVILWRFWDCWPSILVACSWDIEWAIGRVLGHDRAWSFVHRAFLWTWWRHTPLFGLFEVVLVMLALWGLAAARERRWTWRRNDSRPSGITKLAEAGFAQSARLRRSLLGAGER